MGTQTRKNPIIIVGCGRVGMELAQSVAAQSYPVAVMDSNPKAFDRLGSSFRGRMVQGDALDQEALKRAGIENAHGLAAVTSSDSANIITARIARDIYKVAHVVARIYDPMRGPIYERLGLQTIASSSWGARRIEQLLLHPGLQSVVAAGNGEVQVYEIAVPAPWDGRRLGDVLPTGEALPVALARGGRALLPALETALQTRDYLYVSATAAGAASLRQLLRLPGKD
ncbi:MAG: TrkA family potassium uptake protein [Anaerolineales bacterium]|nr:TrkA family potassium uptake protein [Anaerolineales bacterium]